ncbi:HEPN domain-containing protein [Spirochaetota bacterium]
MLGEYKSIEYWLESAKYDFETAKAMLSSKRYLYVGFMCHQAVEKLLKGIFVSIHKDIPPYTHNLKRLMDLTGLTQKATLEQQKTITYLMPLNIQARYPEYRDNLYSSLSYEQCKLTIDKTEELYKWLQNHI